MDHKDVLKEAARLVTDRVATYGEAAAHFDRAARIAALKLDRPITPYEVVVILESVKDARRAYDPRHFDSHVDGINYRAFAAEFSQAGPIQPKMPHVNGADRTDAVNRLAAAMSAVDKVVS